MAFRNGMAQVFDPLRLRLLVEVERRGSVAGAADACGMGQPSATKHLKTLEGAVGERLVRPTGRGSELTEAGRVVADHATRVLGTLGAMHDELRALREGAVGELGIAASTTPGAYVLPGVLKCFAERHPGVDVTVAIGPSARVVERVARREIHIGLAGETAPAPGVLLEPFLEDELIGIAGPGACPDGVMTLGGLALRTLLLRGAGSSTRATAERYLAGAGFTPAKVWELDSNEAIKRGVAAGLGVAFVSRLIAREELARGELSAFAVEGVEPMRRPVMLVRGDDDRLTPAQRAFVDTLAECCATGVDGCTVRLRRESRPPTSPSPSG